MLKRLFIISIILKILVVFGLIYFLDTLAKNYIENKGSEIFSTEFVTDRVNVSILNFSISIGEIQIKNKQNFKNPYALSIKNLDIKIDPFSIFGSKPLHIEKFIINHPTIVYELGPSGDNIDALRISSAQQTTDNKNQLLIRIDDFEINDAKITASFGDDYSFKIPQIAVQNIGKSDGILTSELGEIIMQELIQHIIKVGSKAFIEGKLKGINGIDQLVDGNKIDLNKAQQLLDKALKNF